MIDQKEMHPAEEALFTAARFLKKAELAVFDFDDTICVHNPDFGRLLAFQAIMMDSGDQASLDDPNGYIDVFNAELHGNTDLVARYMERVQQVSRTTLGNQTALEELVKAFTQHVDDGEKQKDTLRSFPFYAHKVGPFWQRRAALLSAIPLHPSSLSLRPGMDWFIRSLHQSGCALAIVSNSRRKLVVDPLKAVAPEIAGLFSDVITAVDDNIPRKPAPDSFRILQNNYPDINPDHTVYIGNSVEDAEYGKVTGINTIILSGATDSCLRTTTNTTIYLRSFDALLKRLGAVGDGA